LSVAAIDPCVAEHAGNGFVDTRFAGADGVGVDELAGTGSVFECDAVAVATPIVNAQISAPQETARRADLRVMTYEQAWFFAEPEV
jgi:hypothetical protein